MDIWTTYKAVPCMCGHSSCKDWHVWPVASVQGVKFSREQAYDIAELLNSKNVLRRWQQFRDEGLYK